MTRMHVDADVVNEQTAFHKLFGENRRRSMKK